MMTAEYWEQYRSMTDSGYAGGVDCFGDDRESMNDFAKYFNNIHLSDVMILCGDETFAAHRLVMARSSDVFDRMLSQKWNGEKKEVELVEEPSCTKVFPAFLRFLYCNHIVLHMENTLPVLILADKYNVTSLKRVCLDYAVNEILPNLTLKEIFSEWFSYATKAYHPTLIRACIAAIGCEFETLISDEWEKEWTQMDRDQIIEILKCNSLVVSNEFRVWEAVLAWLQAPNHSERRGNTASPLLSQILPLIRFPFMTAEELCQVERSPLAETYPKLFMPQILLAYKFQALPLSCRSGKEFIGYQFLLRHYTDVRWDARVVVSPDQINNRISHESSYPFTTRSSTLPLTAWQWSLKLGTSGYASDENIKVCLVSEDIDQPRSVEYLCSICDEKKVLRSVSGKKNFTKTRYQAELQIGRDIPFQELIRDPTLLVNGELYMQIMLRPID